MRSPVEVKAEVYNGRIAVYDTLSWGRGRGVTVDQAIAEHRKIVADTWYLTDDDRAVIEAEYAVIRSQAWALEVSRAMDALGGAVLSVVAGAALAIARRFGKVDRE